ncbi:MAG: hypothetical protein H7A36_07725 [Chlamydiales bacterium]|nr:hypothetical protein [Chlamydiales bacterium]
MSTQIQGSADNSQLEPFEITQKHKPIHCACLALGILGMVMAAVGFAAFGGQKGWWSSGGLSNLSQTSAITMTSIGSGSALVFLIPSIVAMVKSHRGRTLLPLNLRIVMNVNASYEHTNDEGILDLVFSDPQGGWACVVDGTGHNNPKMRNVLQGHFDPFFTKYAKGIQQVRNYDEAERCFRQHVHFLEDQFRDPQCSLNQIKIYPEDKAREYQESENDFRMGTFLDPTFKPAMSFVQLVRIEEKLILLTAQSGDTMVVVEMGDESLKTTQKCNYKGVGGDTNVSVVAFDVTGAKRVIGFSDGIGEFMTLQELKEIVNTSQSDPLFDRLKNRVMSQNPQGRQEKAANGGWVKSYIPKVCEDDLSLFVMDIQN